MIVFVNISEGEADDWKEQVADVGQNSKINWGQNSLWTPSDLVLNLCFIKNTH